MGMNSAHALLLSLVLFMLGCRGKPEHDSRQDFEPTAVPSAEKQEAIPAATIGETCPRGRFVVLDKGSSGCGEDGSGLVKDRATNLTWLRKTYYPQSRVTWEQASVYCLGKAMRLPTVEELRAISGSGYDACAFPCPAHSWTSSWGGGVCNKPMELGGTIIRCGNRAWDVDLDSKGNSRLVGPAFGASTICVR
jgi:hypothetical protein